MFTKLDLKGAFNLIRIAPGHEYLTAFKTKFGLYEYCVMPFGLANAPSVFQAFMDSILKDYLGIFVLCYIDDLLIYSKSPEEHTQHVTTILKILQDNLLCVKLEKCLFHVNTVNFLGYVISSSG